MGEAKRRKTLDLNYGQSNVLKDACKFIDNYLQKHEQLGSKDSLFMIYTNKDRGCTQQEINSLQKEIPSLYQGRNFQLFILPKKYAHLPAEKALNHFVLISVGRQ